jgi:hypothetical protein
MCANELVPGHGLFAFGGRRNPMVLEDVTHRLVTDRIAQMRQRISDTILAPGATLLGHANDQGFERLVDLGASWDLALSGAIKLLRHQLPLPGEDRVGRDDSGYLRRGEGMQGEERAIVGL